ncbi:arginine--tRNA ligase [Paenibacillus sp. GSMTC-2017]|uniref:arginine--tRNA ligase n=1 Tax=Paenibacillus sp. GSMTC-2017 TaxID=2794350 RepID=UPI0018D9CEF8|nr:arginine--tRNA ligase [Paenibacillus sp. GSMTC-2017]MBH5316510.1 arginine--tRNA ligase [Paenibacillus sp. GSMTC-2017]
MISQLLKQKLEQTTEQLLQKEGIVTDRPIKVSVEKPSNEDHGEYSSNVAMQLAKLLRRSPLDIARYYQEKLKEDDELNKIVDLIEIAPPGFINFHLNWSGWAEGLSRQGGGSKPATAKKTLIEHTSINPNKSAHIGHLRNSCIGDTLARLLRHQGHKVEVHNYIDDLGNQLADTVVGLLRSTTEGSFERFGDFCWETYSAVNKAYKSAPELTQQRTNILHQLEEGNNAMAWLGLLVAERIVKEHVDEMNQFGISYDVLVWESDIVREGFWSETFEKLEQTSVFRQEQTGKLAGCWVLKADAGKSDEVSGVLAEEVANDSDSDGHQEDKVLVRSNGVLTYTAKDIAYHLWKFGLLDKDFRYKKFSDGLWTTNGGGKKRSIGLADTVINVIDQRQQYPQAMVKEALIALGFEAQAQHLHHVSYGVVSLSPETAKGLGIDTSDGKRAYAMSGRQGIGVKVSEMLSVMEKVVDERRSRKIGLSSRTIAAAAIRYYLLKYHLQTEVVFDLQQATETTGNTGIYLLYTYARTSSLLEKVNIANVGIELPSFDDLEKQERALLRLLAYWPETLQNAERELSPNVLCTYAHELAATFNHFYAVCPILKAEEGKKSLRVWLSHRSKETLHEVLTILGLPTPKRM